MTKEQRRRLSNHVQWLELPPYVDSAVAVAKDIKDVMAEADKKESDRNEMIFREKQKLIGNLKKAFEKNPHYYNVDQIIEVLEFVCGQD